MPRLHSCNVLHVAPTTRRFWQFDAKGGGFNLNREHSGESFSLKAGAKTWRSLWQPRLNVAWLPPENVFLRVAHLPRSSFEETLAMVELQLEKLSPIPVAQIVWSLHVMPLPPAAPSPKAVRSEPDADAGASDEPRSEDLQTVIVIIAQRAAVEEFLGKLEGQGYLPDRLEAPMLDQLEIVSPTEDSAWIYPDTFAGNGTALVAWWYGGGLKHLSVIALPPAGDRVASLKGQLAQLVWAGELEGWLTAPPAWRLVADTATAAEWEPALREALGEPVQTVEPLPPRELAARTARRAAVASPRANLMPADSVARYRQQFVDRLWLRGLIGVGIVYVIVVAIYLGAVNVLAYHTRGVEQQVADKQGGYTRALQLKARYEVLEQRQDLKFAALDCWQIVAKELPTGLTLQRLSFADGEKLSLSGTCSPDQIGEITDKDRFYDAMRKAKLNDQPIFAASELPSYHPAVNTVSWSFTLTLAHKGEAAK